MLSTAREQPIPDIVPAIFDQATFDDYVPSTEPQAKALAAVRHLVDHEADGFDHLTEEEHGDLFHNVVLAGKTGVGKSTLAAAAVRAIVNYQVRDYNERFVKYEAARAADPGWPAPPPTLNRPKPIVFPMWLNVPDAINEMRWEFGLDMDDRTRTREVRSAATHHRLVVLDDLGREKVSDWTAEQIYTLINQRYENMLPTIVTSNATPEELAASPYWPAISRLAQYGALVWVDGPDHRLR